MLRTVAMTGILALTLTAAQADPGITVSYGDLDLSQSADIHVLGTRVGQAAESACASLKDSGPQMFYRIWFANCVRSTSAEATRRIAALPRSNRIRFALK
jgi:UrcA family protein